MRMSVRTRRTVIAAAGLAALAVAGPAPSAAAARGDAAFLVAVHQANLAEISASENAKANSADPCVRDVADTLIRDHRRLDAAGAALASQLGVALPGAPNPDERRMLAELVAATGTPQFDAKWLAAQVTAHEQALKLIDDEIAHGANPEVVGAAKTARPVVVMHLSLVRGGVCHRMGAAGMVNAGDGGQAAAGYRTRGLEVGGLLGLGALCVAAAAAVTLRRGRVDLRSPGDDREAGGAA